MASNDIVMVFPSSLWPVTGGGARRALDLMAFLRKSGFRVTLVTVDHGEHRAGLAAQCDNLLIPAPAMNSASLLKQVLRKIPGVRAVRARLRRAAGAPATGLAAMRKPALERLAVGTAHRVRPTAVIVYFAPLAHCLAQMPAGTLKIVDTIDVQHLRAPAARAAGGELDRAACTREEEIKALNHAEILLAISPEEAATLRLMCPEVRVMLVSHAASTGEYLPSPDTSREVLLVANLYDPNVRGLQKFFEETWPVVREACPEATLTVCGRVGEAFNRAPAGARFEGVVENLDPYYAQAALVLNPVAYGTGQAIKTLEALARGRALVCTPEGLRGLDQSSGDVPCCAVRQGVDMASAIVELLVDPAKRHKVELRAIEFAKAHYAAEYVYSPLILALNAVQEEPTEQRSPHQRIH